MAEPSDLQHDDRGAADGLDRDIDGGLEGFVDALVSHQRDVYAFIATLLPQAADIEDVYQQTCLALWKKRHQHDSRRAFFPWACGFAKNEALKQIHRSRRQVQLTAGMLELLAGAALADPRAEDRRVALDACLDKLPRTRQRCYPRLQKRQASSGMYLRRVVRNHEQLAAKVKCTPRGDEGP